MKIKDLKQGDTFVVANETYVVNGYSEIEGQPYAKCEKVYNNMPMQISVEVEVMDASMDT